MDEQQVRQELADAEELLGSTTSAHLAYAGRDGTPRVVPVGCWWTGEQFVVSTATTAPKVVALQANPDVALSVDGGSGPGDARALSVRGRADVTVVDGVVPEYLKMARRSMEPDDAEAFEREVRGMYPQMARIAVTPTWARFYDFGSGRMPAFLRDLAAQKAAREAP